MSDHSINDPITVSPLAQWREYLARGELAYQRCEDSGHAVFYPRLYSPHSGAPTLKWEVSKGFGTVYASSTIYPRGADPYNVVLVDCDEGFRMMSRIEDTLPEAVSIGQRVKARVFFPDDDSPPYPVFTLVETAS